MIDAANTAAMVTGYLAFAVALVVIAMLACWWLGDRMRRARRRRMAMEMWEDASE